MLAKVAENENAPLTEEDTKAVAEIEGLTKKVSEAMDAAGVAFDAYANEVE